MASTGEAKEVTASSGEEPPKKRRFKIPNPIAATRRHFARKKVREERRLLRREELMKQDLERFLMELEEKHTWQAYELRERNYIRMVKENNINKIKRKEQQKETARALEIAKETGLSFHHGDIKEYRRWQNSAAKHLDLGGHEGPVYMCRLSACLKYILSCSADKTTKVWSAKNGKCLKTLYGHKKRVFDADFSINFELDVLDVVIVTASGDTTLMYWNCVMDAPLKVLKGHAEAVYRCSFAPDTQRIVSCSEDTTIRTWSVPEGFQLFCYTFHQSPVTTVRFSPSGKYLISGSDYGERKLILWDSTLPLMDSRIQLPHMIYWTPDGTISKLLIQKQTPSKEFWLTVAQYAFLPPDTTISMWPGEQDVEVGDDSSSDDEGAEVVVDSFGSDDIRSAEGVALSVLVKDKNNEKSVATEYIPGSSCVIELQAVSKPLAEAFITVTVKSAQYDMYSTQSGARLGMFNIRTPTPWGEAFQDALQLHPPYRYPPRGMSEQCLGMAIHYKEHIVFDKNGNDITPRMIDVVWQCPKPDSGAVVVAVNFKLRGDSMWRKLSYSLKESPFRLLNTDDSSGPMEGDDATVRYLFNQEERHETFWKYVREKNWEAVESFLEKKESDIAVPTLGHQYSSITDALALPPLPDDEKPEPAPASTEATGDNDDTGLFYSPSYEEKIAEEDDGGIQLPMIQERRRSSLPQMEPEPLDRAAETTIENSADANETPVDAHNPQDGGEENADNANQIQQESDSEEQGNSSSDKSSSSDSSDSSASSGDESSDSGSGDGSSSSESSSGSSQLSAIPEENEAPVNTKKQQRSLTAVKMMNDKVLKFSEQFKPKEERVGRDRAISKVLRYQEAPKKSYFACFQRKKPTLRQIVDKRDDVYAGKRRKTRDLKLPKVIFTDSVQGENFHRQAKSLAVKQSYKQSLLHLFGYSVAVETNPSTCRGKTAAEYKSLPNAPVWLHYHHEEKAQDTAVVATPLIHDSQFGPNIEGLNMTLPSAYPQHAGKAQKALKNNMKNYVRAQREIERSRIPTIAEMQRRLNTKYSLLPSWWVNRKTASSLLPKLFGEAQLHLLSVRTYNAQRRNSHAMLPGLEPHYPNSYYENPATIMPNCHFKMEKKSFFSRLFQPRKKKNVVELADAVGRKPAQMSSQHASHRPQTMTPSQHRRLSRKQSMTEKLQLLIPGSVTTTLRRLSMSSHATPATTPRSLAQLTRRSSENKSEENTAFEDDIPKQSKFLFWRKASRPGTAVSNEAPKEMVPTTNAFQYPPGFYTERRGSFIVAPGLALEGVSSSDAALDPAKHSLMPSKKGGAPRDSNFDIQSKSGVIRIMKNKAVSIAHQGTINDATFSPSELRLASCGSDHMIKIWDPRDGSCVRTLKGHTDEVRSVSYTKNELYLISCGSDMVILIWDLMINKITRELRGHTDVINCVSISHDCTSLVSCSDDGIVKTYFLTPKAPDPPQAPRIVTATHSTVMLTWTAPPSFNEQLTAFHLQHRVFGQDVWSEATSIPPHYRTKVIVDLAPNTSYQFRLMAENRMGKSEWGAPSRLVKTEIGLPSQVERPVIADTTIDTLTIYFFTPNPKSYGSAATIFRAEIFGGEMVKYDGKDYFEFTLDEGAKMGKFLVDRFQRKIAKSANNKKKKGESSGSGIDVPLETMREVVEKSSNVQHIFVAIVLPNLTPGTTYRVRVAGVNGTGQGQFSMQSYSQATLPGPPHTPAPPTKDAAGLTWVRFRWVPPNDRGSAITGYRIWAKHMDFPIDLPRWQVSFECYSLDPGRQYYLKVAAKNAVGITDYSDFGECSTDIDIPDTPNPPTAIAATWGSLTLALVMPYANGSDCTLFYVQYRIVQAFSKGQWSNPIQYNIKDVKSRIPYEAPASRDEDEAKKAQPAVRKREIKIQTGKLEQVTLQRNTQIQFKPPGDTIHFEVENLAAHTLYEFRVCFQNAAGCGQYSTSSQRAKTRKAVIPDRCKVPRFQEVASSYLVIQFEHPSHGGEPIKSFLCELKDVNHGDIQRIRISPHKSEHKLEGLNPGGSYQVCIRAENAIGLGMSSNWSKVVVLPKEAIFVDKKLLDKL